MALEASTSAWDLASETVEEALRSGLAPSLEPLGRLGQVGSLPALVAALLLQADARSVGAFLERLAHTAPQSVRFSAGAAYMSERPGSAEDLFALADRQLYDDKTAKAA